MMNNKNTILLWLCEIYSLFHTTSPYLKTKLRQKKYSPVILNNDE